MGQSNAIEKLWHWISDHSDSFHDRLFDVIELAKDGELKTIESAYPEEVAAFKKYGSYNFQVNGKLWDFLGVKTNGDGYLKLESDRTYDWPSFTEPCCICPICRKQLEWDTPAFEKTIYLFTHCCGFEYRAIPTRVFLEIEKIEE